MWSIETSCGNESAKIRWELPRYTRGLGLDIGCGAFKAFPHFVGIDNYTDTRLFGTQMRPDIACDGRRLKLFADKSVDFVFSAHFLEHVENPAEVLKEWSRVVKSHLILYLPDEDEYPKVGEEGANPDHKWNVNYDRVVEMMDAVPRDWDLIRYEKRNQNDEYSLFFVFKF